MSLPPSLTPPSSADERRIASSQSGDRERDPKNAGMTGRMGFPSVSALNEKAIRGNIQTLDGGGDRDVVMAERGGGECHSNEITFGDDVISEHKRSLASSLERKWRTRSLLSGSSPLTLLTQ